MTLPDHHQKCLLTDLFGRDSIDRDQHLDDLNIADPYESHAPSRKSDAELNRVLAILDNLGDGKETTR
jgi:hypothetical protein